MVLYYLATFELLQPHAVFVAKTSINALKFAKPPTDFMEKNRTHLKVQITVRNEAINDARILIGNLHDSPLI